MTDQQTAPNVAAEPAPPTPKPAAPSAPPPPAARSRRKLIPLILVILGVVAFFVWRGYFANPKVPDSIVIVSGRIEGDDSAGAPKTAGRILEVRVREGDRVKAGDTIAVLDDAQIRAREDQARAALLGAEARAKSAHDQVAVYEQQLHQNDLMTEQSKVDAAGRVRQAEADLAAAQSDPAQQQDSLNLTKCDTAAYQKLQKTGAASDRQAIQAAATANQQAAAVAAAQ